VKKLKEAEKMDLSSLESAVRRLAFDVEILLDAFRDEDVYATYMILEDMEECTRAVTEHIRATSPVVKDWWEWLRELAERRLRWAVLLAPKGSKAKRPSLS